MSELNASNLRKEHGNEGPDLVGVTELTSPYYMVPPSGTTKQRPEDPQPGTLRFNTDIGSLEYFKGDTIGWEQIEKRTSDVGGALTSGSIDGRGTRALWAGGYISPGPCFNNVDAITVDTCGNTIDFNNLTASTTGGFTCADRTRAVYAGGRTGTTPGGPSTDEIQYATFSTQNDYQDSTGNLGTASAFGCAFSDKTRGIFAGRSVPAYNDTMEYVTVQSLGSSLDFGDLTYNTGYCFALSSTTRGIALGGLDPGAPSASGITIQYVTIQTKGDMVDFGDLNYGKYEGGAGSSATRGIIGGGYGPNYTPRIEYITMATKGNSVHFGDLDALNGTGKYSASSPTRFVMGGGYNHGGDSFSNIIEYVQIATTGGGTDFGDFINFGRRANSFNNACNGHGGL